MFQYNYLENIAEECKNLTSKQILHKMYGRIEKMYYEIVESYPTKRIKARKAFLKYLTTRERYFSLARFYIKSGRILNLILYPFVQIYYKYCIYVMKSVITFLIKESKSDSKTFDEIMTYERIIWKKYEITIFGKEIFDINWKRLEGS